MADNQNTPATQTENTPATPVVGETTSIDINGANGVETITGIYGQTPEGTITIDGLEVNPDTIAQPHTPAFEMPEKFVGKTAEEIAKIYADLEKKMGQQSTNPTDDAAKAAAEATKAAEEAQAAADKEANAKAPSDLSKEVIEKYKASYNANGELSADDYASLEKEGYSKNQVNDYIEYEAFKTTKLINSIVEPLGGGLDKYNQVAAWISSTFDDKSLAEVNEVLANSPMAAKTAYLGSLYTQFDAANGSISALHGNNGVASTASGIQGYATKNDFMADLDNPKYTTNPEFRKMVEGRLSVSDPSVIS